MTRVATVPELALFRTPGQFSKVRAAIFQPATVYTARVNQTFTTTDGIVKVAYDGGVGTLADVKPDMTILVGSAAGLHDKGICRERTIDGSFIYIGETADIAWANDLYLTIINDFGLWARHIKLDGDDTLMDGAVTYSDQHTNFDPVVRMGGNRVLKLTGATVSAIYDASASSVYDSTITGYAWVAPGSSSSSGMTTATPTITYNAVGWYVVYLTLTAANGKTFMGVRYIYVWSVASPPASAGIGEARQDAETGGWQFSLTLYDNVNLATVRDHALVLLFAEDYYGTTNQSIGFVEGCENVLVEGWIAGESINWEPENGLVEFTAYTAQFWLGRIPSYPDGVELVSGVPAAWTEMNSLTVDRGIWHFLHWRTTATRIMDIFLTGDTKYTPEVSSLASTLWEQIREMAFLQIFARAGCNAHNQFFLEVHPQLVPLADRDWDTVMTITEADWEGQINIERVTIQENAVVSLSGIAVDINGEAVPFFSLSPGHTLSRYGSTDIVDNILVETQAQSNSLAGLYRGWLNNQYPDIPITFSSNMRLIDCFPRQQFAIVIEASDTIRGIEYTGNIIPKSVSLIHDVETGYLYTEATFEAETFEDLSINGDVPGGSEDVPSSPGNKFPPLPPFEQVYPLDISSEPNGPPVIIICDNTKGLLYTINGDTEEPGDVRWSFSNAGIPAAKVPYIGDVRITPNGSVWLSMLEPNYLGRWYDALWYAPAIGAKFTEVVSTAYLESLFGSGGTGGRIGAWGINPNKPEEIAFLGYSLENGNGNFMLGDHNSFTQKVSFVPGGELAQLTYGVNQWSFNQNSAPGYIIIFAGDGSSVVSSTAIVHTANTIYGPDGQIRAGTSGTIFFVYNHATGLARFTDGDPSTVDMIDTVNPISTHCAVSHDGQNLMGSWDPVSGSRGRSSDGGYTWSGIPNLAVGGDYAYCYCGGVGTESRWLAANGYVRFSPDFGETWLNREGNINGLIPVGLNIVKILVPGY